MKFRLNSAPQVLTQSGAENQWESHHQGGESSVIVSQTVSSPDVLNRYNPGDFEDESKDSAKCAIQYYGDIPIIELRRACIMLALSIAVRRRF